MTDLSPTETHHHRIQGVIKLNVLFHIALRNLFFKKLRTGLTILGVVIGIGSIVFLVSLGSGLQRLVSQQVVGSDSVKTIDVTSPKSKVIKLDPETLAKLQSLTDVTKVARVYNFAGKIALGSSKTDSVVYGVDQTYLDLTALKNIAGNTAKVDQNGALVNLSLLKAIGISDSKQAVGQSLNAAIEVPDEQNNDQKKTITINATIAGVVDSGTGSEIYLNDQIFQQAGVTVASQAKVLSDSQQNVADIKKQIEALGLSTSSPLDTLTQINQIFNLFNIILVGFGGIGMIIAVLGMFNTLTISLLERTREIGLMISLGAREKDVKRLFIVEALGLSLMGGVIGIAAAYLVGIVVNLLLNGWAASRGVSEHISAFYVAPWLVASTIVFVTIIGLLVVYFPARRASHINPIDALRHE